MKHFEICRITERLFSTARSENLNRTPIAYLICNQSPPTDIKPSLMTFGEVKTLFHEVCITTKLFKIFLRSEYLTNSLLSHNISAARNFRFFRL